MPTRCPWAEQSALEQSYHDHEWGVPVKDDCLIFEELSLGVFQAGLSWRLILSKREHFRAAFHGFLPEIVAEFSDEKIQELCENPLIVRNRKKIQATVSNAKASLKIQQSSQSLSNFMWAFVDHSPVQNQWKVQSEVPCQTPVSQNLANALKSEGFKFMGPKLCYGVMQAIGMVNDHIVECYRYNEITDLQKGH